MSMFRLRSFSKPEVLKTISPSRLQKLLLPYHDFFSARGFVLPTTLPAPEGDIGLFDYDRLTEIFMTPDSPIPAPPLLVDTLYLLDEMASPDAMDALINGAAKWGVRLSKSSDQAPIDVCVEAWLIEPDFVENTHAEQLLEHLRSFDYYPANQSFVSFKLPGKEELRAIETKLDDWFDKHRRGRGARIFTFPREKQVWFLIRHGEPLRREGSMEDGCPSSVLYRPEKFDIVVYDQALGELRVNAMSKGEKNLYRETFGSVLFGNKDLFVIADKFTLDPLRVEGATCLKCEDIEGLEWIRLLEIQFLWGGAQGDIEIRKGKDVFAAYSARGQQMPSKPKIIKARFEVKFAGSKRPRKVSVSANRTQCVRNEDAVLIERWLRLRGFVVDNTEDHHGAQNLGEQIEKVLVGA